MLKSGDRVKFGQLNPGEVFSNIPLEEQEDNTWENMPQDLRDSLTKVGLDKEMNYLEGKNYPESLKYGGIWVKVDLTPWLELQTERNMNLNNAALNLNTGRVDVVGVNTEVLYINQSVTMMHLNSANECEDKELVAM